MVKAAIKFSVIHLRKVSKRVHGGSVSKFGVVTYDRWAKKFSLGGEKASIRESRTSLMGFCFDKGFLTWLLWRQIL